MKRRLLAVLAVAAFVAGCGSTSNETPQAQPSTPQRIVSLSPTATEMLFAVGAGNQVVAVDEFSNYPPQAPKTDLSGFTPNAEAIAAKNPDLVVLSDDVKGIVAQLEGLKIPVYVAPAAKTMDDVYGQITEVGKRTGHADQATALNQQIKDDLAKLVKDLPKREKPLTYFYELDPALYSATSKTFIGSLFTMAGLSNVVDAADTSGSGYPQISAEALIAANPDLIFLADGIMGETPEKVKARPGWQNIGAVTNNQIVVLDSDIASRWGPRVVDLMRSITNAAETAK
ncbi:ABC transporter substrate-binding protein [Catelliglobosispora koreensis]|uniref:ABC transporter substrate-binding protein n=1 Tax=Catelliglobosispora koreensis TaxID=129052 RepID=UPI00035DFC21|nr:ABC transporter substrate-binding protein [Catelliglobosispora koreensis]